MPKQAVQLRTRQIHKTRRQAGGFFRVLSLWGSLIHQAHSDDSDAKTHLVHLPASCAGGTFNRQCLKDVMVWEILDELQSWRP